MAKVRIDPELVRSNGAYILELRLEEEARRRAARKEARDLVPPPGAAAAWAREEAEERRLQREWDEECLG